MTDARAETVEQKRSPRLPPRWFIRTAWMVHRAIYRFTGHRRGLWLPGHNKRDKWGTFVLNTVGRRSGKKRSVILGYYEDGPNLVTMAMNGWGKAEPAWWLNLQSQPDVTVETKTGSRQMRGRAAVGEERARLWARCSEHQAHPGDLEGYSSRRPTETAVVILEPRD